MNLFILINEGSYLDGSKTKDFVTVVDEDNKNITLKNISNYYSELGYRESERSDEKLEIVEDNLKETQIFYYKKVELNNINWEE
jgi:hypothetical protein